MGILNWKLISHPVNWIIILLMVIVGVMIVNLIMTPWHSGNAGGIAPMPSDQS